MDSNIKHKNILSSLLHIVPAFFPTWNKVVMVNIGLTRGIVETFL